MNVSHRILLMKIVHQMKTPVVKTKVKTKDKKDDKKTVAKKILKK